MKKRPPEVRENGETRKAEKMFMIQLARETEEGETEDYPPKRLNA